MLEFLTQSTWADRIGWVLVHSLWQFALVALLAVVLQRALQRRSATTRYWGIAGRHVRYGRRAGRDLVFAVVCRCTRGGGQVRPGREACRDSSVAGRFSIATPGIDTSTMAALPAESPVELAAKPQPEPAAFAARAGRFGLVVVAGARGVFSRGCPRSCWSGLPGSCWLRCARS